MVKQMNCGMVDPQILLGMALEKRDISDFRIALDMGANPDRMIDKEEMSIFEKALQTFGCVAFVEECLRRECNAAHVNRQANKSALSFAADSRDPKILKCLLEHSKANLDRQYAKLTPLNSLAKNLTAENFEDVSACIDLLLHAGASPNIADQREMSPILHVIKNEHIPDEKKRLLLQEFLNHPDIDLDTFRKGEARRLLESDFSELHLPSATPDEINFNKLLVLLKHGNEKKFLNEFSSYRLNTSQQDNKMNTVQEQNMELLMAAITKGLHKAFDAILDVVQNVNLLHENSSAIRIACVWGNAEALGKLLNRDDLELRPHENLLITVVKKLQEESYNDFCDNMKCFYILLDSQKIDVNETDLFGSTPLHYAVKYHNEVAIMQLLKHGAYIGSKSKFNDLPIDEIDPDLLEEYFDSCIITNDHKPGDSGFEIIINYSNLIPNQPPQGKSAFLNFRQEMTPITRLAESKSMRHLLKHPLITSFLFFKWHRLSLIFYINLLIYSLFFVSFITHTVMKFQESENQAAINIFAWISIFGIGYLIVREVMQMLISPLSYFKSVINYLEIIMIGLCIATVYEQTYDKQMQRVVAVFAILLLALELSLLVGSLPILSISTHMLMLKAVLNSFIKSFALYSIFVITFSLSFFILFGKEGSAPTNGADGGKSGEEGLSNFSNPFTAVIKTIVMLTGEFDASDIGFETWYSYLVFLLFVIFMSIVLFNLLNGLAVNDTHEIKEQAELNGSICRANLLLHYENTLANPSQICREPRQRLINIFPHLIAGTQISILPNDGNKVLIPVSNSGEMRELQESNSMETFLPLRDNDYEKRPMSAPNQVLPCCMSPITRRCAQMDTKTVKMALAVIDRNIARTQRKSREELVERRLLSIENKLQELINFNQSVSS